ncbi:hypothetical protein CRE_20533 [Caenorhabditis remanei]|uniref:Uncharacterized protein n=1 Tax=Caenorhabditis remanei TaxID=31234 RepID=E3N8C6_CAERE|nr:hypothetical protein CRE_20533 [Caenorhabditis remanei]
MLFILGAVNDWDRGVGLFWGIGLVKDRQTREPDQKLAIATILALRKSFGILLNANGPYTNSYVYHKINRKNFIEEN